MRKNGQRSFGVDVDCDLLEAFTKQYTSRGFKKYRTLEGAMRLWINLPNEVQALLISDPELDTKSIGDQIGHRLREALHNALALDEQSKSTPKAGGAKNQKSRC